uniref:Uncharacterized protein n=1 Tax=Arundo donax TaxID=35708 RepID=A0A0A9EV82_ARUDO
MSAALGSGAWSTNCSGASSADTWTPRNRPGGAAAHPARGGRPTRWRSRVRPANGGERCACGAGLGLGNQPGGGGTRCVPCVTWEWKEGGGEGAEEESSWASSARRAARIPPSFARRRRAAEVLSCRRIIAREP